MLSVIRHESTARCVDNENHSMMRILDGYAWILLMLFDVLEEYQKLVTTELMCITRVERIYLYITYHIMSTLD